MVARGYFSRTTFNDGTLFILSRWVPVYIQERDTKMRKIAFAAATAAAIVTAAPLFGGAIPAKADNLQLAQRLDVEVNRDRDRDDWRGRDF